MILFIMVFLPILAALAAYPITRRSEKAGNALIISVTLAVFAMAMSLLGSTLTGAELPGFCGSGLTFACGSMQTVMAIIAAFMWLMTAFASPEYFDHARCNARYYMFYLWTLGALMGVFLAGDLMTLFIFFEIMSFTSYVWVVQNETPEAIRASETYLFVAVIGGLTMLMGIFLLYAACGTLSFSELPALAANMSEGRKLAVGICILVGFGAKAGMFPLHIWLPKAHPVAPAPASALLSGILTKSGIFGVVVLSFHVLDSFGQTWGNILLVPAVITMVLGAVLAVFSTDLKRTLACSSMSQIGFILTGIAMACLLGEHGGIAAYGTMLHMLNHSLIKLTLFVAAGVVYFNVHSLNLNDVRGFGRDKPLLMVTFLMGACSIAGIPGFSGYISKTLIHESIVEYIHELSAHGANVLPYQIAEWLFLFSGGLTLAYMARLFYIIFIAKKPRHQHQKEGKYMGELTSKVLILGGALMPVLGLTAHSTMDRIAEYAVHFFNRHPMDHAVHYFAWVNLKGAVISISIGTAVFLLVGMLWLTKRKNGEEEYINVWPRKLDLDDYAYRPALKGLAFIGAVFARCVETIGAVLVMGPVNLIFTGAEKEVIPPEDEEFGKYSAKRQRSIFSRDASLDPLIAAIGVVAVMVFLMINL